MYYVMKYGKFQKVPIKNKLTQFQFIHIWNEVYSVPTQ